LKISSKKYILEYKFLFQKVFVKTYFWKTYILKLISRMYHLKNVFESFKINAVQVKSDECSKFLPYIRDSQFLCRWTSTKIVLIIYDNYLNN